MSIHILNLVWPLQLPPPAKVVALAMADYANDTGYCYPSLSGLCERTCYGRTAVIAAIKALEALGVVTADRSDRYRTRYQINLDTLPKLVRQANQSASRTSSHSGALVRVANNEVRQANDEVRQTDTNHQEPPRTTNEATPTPGPDGSFEPPNDRPLAELVEEARRGPVAVAVLLRRHGCPDVHGSHPELVTALDAGVTVSHLTGLAQQFRGKPIKYLVSAALRQKAEAGVQATPTNGRDGPPLSKTAQAFLTLEGMKSGNDVDPRRDFAGPAEAPVAVAGPDAGR